MSEVDYGPIGPAEMALRSAGLSPLVTEDGDGFEASVKAAGERRFGFGDSREMAVRDLTRDIPESVLRTKNLQA